MLRPSLRTGLADLPHPALRSVVFSSMETGDFRDSGLFQAEEAKRAEVAVGPSLVIGSPSSAPTSTTFAQDRPEPSADPSVDVGQLGRVDVLEVTIPTLQRPVEPGHDRRHALAIGPARPGFDGFARLAQAPGSYHLDQTPPRRAAEPVTQEVKMTPRHGHVHHAGLVRMQGQSGPGHPFPELVQSGPGFLDAVAQDDQSSAKRTISKPSPAISQSSGSRYTLASSGLMTPPCGTGFGCLWQSAPP